MFRRLRERLSRTRETLAGGLDRLLRGRKEVDAVLLEELEELLITADIGVATTLALIQALHEKLRRRELADVERLKAALKAEMVALLTAPPPPSRAAPGPGWRWWWGSTAWARPPPSPSWPTGTGPWA